MNNYNRMYEYNISDSSIYYQPTQQTYYTEKPSKTDDHSITFENGMATFVAIVSIVIIAYNIISTKTKNNTYDYNKLLRNKPSKNLTNIIQRFGLNEKQPLQ